MYPYSVALNATNAVNLYKLDDGRFQLVSNGNLYSFLEGHDYILIDSELADFLNSLNIPEIEFKDAVLWDREADKENKDFKELIVKNSFHSEDFEDFKLEGLQMYLYNGRNLFVSPKLKETLGKFKHNYFSFGEGFELFAR